MKNFTLLFILLFSLTKVSSQTVIKCSAYGSLIGNPVSSQSSNYIIEEGDSFRISIHFSCSPCNLSLSGPHGASYGVTGSPCSGISPYYRDSGNYNILGSDGADLGYWLVHVAFATPTALSEIKNTEFSLSPNPVSDEVNIQFAGALKEQCITSVYSITGNLVYSSPIDEGRTNSKIPFAAFKPGYYLIEVSDKNQQSKSFHKILKL